MWKIKKKQGIDLISKWEIVENKRCRKYKAGDKYCHLRMEEKLAIASYHNPNELLNQRSEIPNACSYKKKPVHLVNRIWLWFFRG